MLCNKTTRVIKRVGFIGRLRNKKQNREEGLSFISCLSKTTKVAAPSILDIFQEMHYNNGFTPAVIYTMLYKTFFLTAETEIIFFVFDIIIIYIDLLNRIKKRKL